MRKRDSALWSLYDSQETDAADGAKLTTPGVAQQLAWKLTLARSGTVRMLVIYGVLTHEEHPGSGCAATERLRGVPVEAPARHSGTLGTAKRSDCRRLKAPGIGRIAAACKVGAVDHTRRISGLPVRQR